ncbi:EAL domain-containing protein [Ferrimonas senticii]|uniref:EAL domain-containing protein n=1 Tax=Ferrimonas senticii TaxID=394566 RepID=UPI00040DE15A|nr:EAL domain-containing protein [Ferrimonas senticii]
MTLFKLLFWGFLALMVVQSSVQLTLSFNGSQHLLKAQLQQQAQQRAALLYQALQPALQARDYQAIQAELQRQVEQQRFHHLGLRLPQHRLEATASEPRQSLPRWFQLMVAFDFSKTEQSFPQATLVWQPSTDAAAAFLWRQTLQWLLAQFLLVVAGMLLWLLLLKGVLRPLQLAERQAKGLHRHRYLRQRHVPYIREVASLVRAMNQMVDNSEAQFKQQLARLERLRKRTLHDEVTGLGNHRLYLQQLEQALNDREYQTGVVLRLHLTGLDQVVLRAGVGAEQGLLQKIAEQLQQWALQLPYGKAYRVATAEFALLFAGVTSADVAALEQPVRQRLSVLLRQAGGQRLLLAGCDYRHQQPLQQLQQRLEQAFSEALACTGVSVFQLLSPASTAAELASQPQQLQRILATPPKLLLQAAQRSDGSVLHHELLARFSDGQRWFNPAPVLALVMRQQCQQQLDLWVLEQVLARQSQWPSRLSCNLTAESVLDPLMAGRLQRLLAPHWRRLQLEIPERALQLDLDGCQRFIDKLSSHGAQLWLDNVTPVSMALLNRHGLAGIKLDPSYTKMLIQAHDHDDLLELMVATAHSRGMQVIAQQVEQPQLAQRLWQLGVDGVQGFAVATPEAFADGESSQS